MNAPHGEPLAGLYLDSSCIIYLVEASNPFHRVVVDRVLHSRSDPTQCLLTSRLSRLECRTLPLREGNSGVLSAYEAFFASKALVIGELTPFVVEKATELRAHYGFKTPDALHLATAIEHRASAFLTGDARLARCNEVPVEVISA